MATQKDIIDQAFPETLKILSDLINFQTVSGTSNLKLIEYCEGILGKIGAESFKTINESTQQANLFSTISGKEKINGGGIILSGHTDVVPASPKEWSSDPYSATEKDNKKADVTTPVESVEQVAPASKETLLKIKQELETLLEILRR